MSSVFFFSYKWQIWPFPRAKEFSESLADTTCAPVRYKLPPTWWLCNAGMQGVKLWAFLMAPLCVCARVCACLLLSRSESPPLPLIRSMSPFPAMQQPARKKKGLPVCTSPALSETLLFVSFLQTVVIIAYCRSTLKVAAVTKKEANFCLPVWGSKKKKTQTTVVLLSLKSCLTGTLHSSRKLRSGWTP